MAIIPTHQNRHFFVVNKVETSNEITPASDAGSIRVKTIGEGNEQSLFFVYKGKGESLLTTDKIQLKNLDYGKAVDAFDMLVPLKSVKVTLDSTINSGNPVLGQDYLLRIAFRQFFGMSDEDQYFKDAVVRITPAMVSDKKEFYKAMVKSLNLNFSREIGATKNSNPYLEFSAGTAGSEDGIYITEKIQPHTTGIQAQERVYFDVFPTTIFYGANDVIWAAQDATTGKYYADITPAKYVEDEESESDTPEMIPNEDLVAGTNAIGNGAKIADLEWFCMGERGDQYRMKGWPNYIPTQYMVDESNEYYVFELHFAFTDWGVDSYRSEKDITFVSTDKAKINALIGAINSAASTSFATL